MDTTVASNFFIPKISSGMVISMSSLTFTWQPRRAPEASSFLVKLGTSVGRGSPPPLRTWHSH